jgi:hypothetical protein
VPALGSLQLSRVSAQAINAFYAKLLASGRLQGKGSLSPATVRRAHATLHRALKDAVRWQRLAVNPVDAADPPRGQSKQRELPAWNAEQLAGFLSHVKGDRLFAFWKATQGHRDDYDERDARAMLDGVEHLVADFL